MHRTIFALSSDPGCFWVAGAKQWEVRVCQCYAKYYGVDRRHMRDAVHEFCQAYDGHTWGPVNTPYTPYGIAAHYYEPKKNSDEKGMITVQLKWTGGTNGGDPLCASWPYTLTYDTCFNGFHAPIDQCNTKGENGKQGGVGVDACMIWIVDPNPILNEPDVPVPKVFPTTRAEVRDVRE